MKRYNNVIQFFAVILVISILGNCSEKAKEGNAVSNNHAVVKLIDKEYDFGKINMSDSIVHAFYIKNIGDIPLHISDVRAGCSCTVTNWEKKPVIAFDSTQILVTFLPNGEGKVRKSIVVQANTKPIYNVFYLKGEITKKKRGDF